MRQKFGNFLRSTMLFLVLSAGMLAMTNVDLSWYPVAMTVSQKSAVAPKSLWTKLTEGKVAAEDTGPAGQLRALLEQDDLADQNPFANLSSQDPLNDIFKAGVVRFQRKTLRSRTYRDESGYDLVHYEIDQAGGHKSQILAYLEREAGEITEGDISGEGQPSMHVEVPVILVVRNAGEQSEYSVFRDGALIESSTISTPDADHLLTQRLSDGIPFLSVSR